MVAGLPKDPAEPVRSIGIPLALNPLAHQRGAPRRIRSHNAFADTNLGMMIGGFALRGEARSIDI
jgi:hypothetical protein